jgi:hypothetical protein
MPGRIAAAGATPTQRAALFYGVCIWVRVGLAVGVYFAAEWELEGTMIAVIVASSAVTVVELALAAFSTNVVWWSHAAHAAIWFLVALSAVASLFTAAVPAVVLFLLADVGWGVAHSLVARPFKNGSL